MLCVGAALLVTAAGCGSNSATPASSATGEGATAKAPTRLTIGFVPTQEADKTSQNAAPLVAYLEKELKMPVTAFTATNYAGLIEAMGSGKVDVGELPALGYVLANEQNGAKLLCQTTRDGKSTYRTQFVALASSPLKKIEEAKGKKMAFVDPGSTSGYLFPAAYLKKEGFDPEKFFSQTTFAGSHDAAIIAVYNGDVDVAAVYEDARNVVSRNPAYKDVKSKVKVIGYSAPIPNETFSTRADLDPALSAKIHDALLTYAKTPEGKKTLNSILDVDGLHDGKDSDYDVVRQTAKTMDLGPDSLG